MLVLTIMTLGIGISAMLIYRSNEKNMFWIAAVMTSYIVIVVLYLILNWWDALTKNTELKEARKIAYSDKMTDLENRRAYDEYIALLNEKIKSGDADDRLFVMMMDVNGLKKTNDIFGHIAGDELLVGSAECIYRNFGDHGRCFRSGGDEFIVIAAMEEDDFERRKKNLEEDLKAWNGEHIQGIAISVGKAGHSEFPEATMEELIDIADRRMYVNKQHYYASQLQPVEKITEANSGDKEMLGRLRYVDNFSLTKYTMPVIQQMAEVIPGGFFIYKEDEKREILYCNRKVFELFGCDSKKEFDELTGGTFEGMVHPEDFKEIQDSIDQQIDDENGDGMDHVIYRIVQKDGSIRWMDDYGHFSHSDDYGDIYYVFINDITDSYQPK